MVLLVARVEVGITHSILARPLPRLTCAPGARHSGRDPRPPTLVPTVHKRKTVPAGTVGKLQPNGAANDASDRTSGAGLGAPLQPVDDEDVAEEFQGCPVAGKVVEAGGPLLIVELASALTDGLPPAFTQIDPASVGNAWLAFGWGQPRLGGHGGNLVARSGDGNRSGPRGLWSARDAAARRARGTRPSDQPNSQGMAPARSDRGGGQRNDANLNSAMRLLNKNYRHGIKQSALLNAYYASDAVALPIDLTARIEQHRWAHSQVWDKLEAFRQRLCNVE